MCLANCLVPKCSRGKRLLELRGTRLDYNHLFSLCLTVLLPVSFREPVNDENNCNDDDEEDYNYTNYSTSNDFSGDICMILY